MCSYRTWQYPMSLGGDVRMISKDPKMTTDNIEVKDDLGTKNPDPKRVTQPKADGLSEERRQPLQPQQRVEREDPGPDVTTDDGVGLQVGNKGKSPGNGG